MRNAAPLQVESNAVRAEKIRKAAVHDECQQSLGNRRDGSRQTAGLLEVRTLHELDLHPLTQAISHRESLIRYSPCARQSQNRPSLASLSKDPGPRGLLVPFKIGFL